MGGRILGGFVFDNNVLGVGMAYIVGGTGVPDVASHNQVMAVDFY